MQQMTVYTLAAAVACCLLSLFSGSQSASADTFTETLIPFTGQSSEVKLTFDDTTAGAGNIQVTVDVVPNPNIGDIRGVFLHILDESLLGGLSASGPDLMEDVFGPANSVINLGGGNNLQSGPSSPCPCDLGFEFGTPGIGSDDLQTTTFTLMHESVALDLSQFFGQLAGARLTSVGLPDSSREGSSKLGIPEPTTLLLAATGLLGYLATRSRRRYL